MAFYWLTRLRLSEAPYGNKNARPDQSMGSDKQLHAMTLSRVACDGPRVVFSLCGTLFFQLGARSIVGTWAPDGYVRKANILTRSIHLPDVPRTPAWPRFVREDGTTCPRPFGDNTYDNVC